MKKEKVKEFNEIKHKNALTEIDKKITDKKSDLDSYFLKNFTNINCPGDLPLIEEDNLDIKGLLEKWQKLEFSAYGKLPNKVFSSVGV